VRAPVPGELVSDLPWLSPGADALVALACESSSSLWSRLREDPGAVLLLVRHTHAFATPDHSFLTADLLEASLPEAALSGLREHSSAGWIDWLGDATHEVYRVSLACAGAASRVAEVAGLCDPATAWVAGLLASLGWQGMCAVRPEAVRACLDDPEHAREPSATQVRHWGYDQAALARRLVRTWNLPTWLGALIGSLGLPAEVARSLGTDEHLFATVQLAVHLVERRTPILRLSFGSSMGPSAHALALTSETLESLEEELAKRPAAGETRWAAPGSVPLLCELLALAVENRRLQSASNVRRLEEDLDVLHDAVREARAGEEERLQEMKLAALAEFAAGAGHEINNPLAVISGHAQHLLNKLRPRLRVFESIGEENGLALPSSPAGMSNGVAPVALGAEEIEPPLRKIVEQTQRVHRMLRDLMQFARPPRPLKQLFDLGNLVLEVVGSLSDLAGERRIRLMCLPPERPVVLEADPSQVRTALTCLLRNAVEAAPQDGWAGVRVELASIGCINLVIEDNGPGPPPAQREHLFDPFYSGRSAGRGRGLGLPTAWRLARQHGGDVRLIDLADGPTRFVLTLPHSPLSAELFPVAAG
jgi:signal transduction histidine kinase